MYIKKYWYWGGPLLIICSLGILFVIEQLIKTNDNFYIPAHVILFPALLMFWSGVLIVLGTVAYLLVKGVRGIFGNKKRKGKK